MIDILYDIALAAAIYLLLNPQYSIQGESLVTKKKAAVKVKPISETERKIRITLSELLIYGTHMALGSYFDVLFVRCL